MGKDARSEWVGGVTTHKPLRVRYLKVTTCTRHLTDDSLSPQFEWPRWLENCFYPLIPKATESCGSDLGSSKESPMTNLAASNNTRPATLRII